MNKMPPAYLPTINFLKNRLLNHTLFWFVFISCVFLSAYPVQKISWLYLIIIESLMYMTITYVTIWFLIPRFFHTARFFMFSIIAISICSLFSFFDSLVSLKVYKESFPIEAMNNNLNIFWYSSIGINILIFLLSLTIKLVKDLLIFQYETEKSQKEKSLQELNFLRSQLSPHFLLNTMNNLYGLAVKKSDTLPKLILQLSDLLRFSIYDTKTDSVNLKSEINYLQDFIALQKIRVNNKAKITIDIPTIENTNKCIMPMVLVVFIENCFKHYTSAFRACFIDIKIKIEDDLLYFESANSYERDVTLNSNSSYNIKSEGIGLENTLRRLELIYGKESLPVITNNNGIYKVQIVLKLTNGKN